MKKRGLLISVVMMMVLCLAGCGKSTLEDYVTDEMKKENDDVLAVKEGDKYDDFSMDFKGNTIIISTVLNEEDSKKFKMFTKEALKEVMDEQFKDEDGKEMIEFLKEDEFKDFDAEEVELQWVMKSSDGEELYTKTFTFSKAEYKGE